MCTLCVWLKNLFRQPPGNSRAADAVMASGLVAQLQSECNAMARYALRHGLAVPPELISQLASLTRSNDSSSLRAVPDNNSGRALPAAQDNGIFSLASIHRRLAAAIAPATPQAVTLLDPDRRAGQPLAWLGPVPLIRFLTIAASLFLFAVIATALAPDVSADNVDRGFLDSYGMQLLWNVLFLMFCAGLGASFAALFQAHRYIADSTYDPKYDASYGARLILGVIAGLILVEMLPADLFNKGAMHSFGKPALAMLGGFSATAVYRLLQRLVETLETVVSGDPATEAQAAFETHRAQAATDRAHWQSGFAADLLQLQQSFDAQTSPEVVRQRLADFTRTILSPDVPRTPVSNAGEENAKE
jgi:hypothetical protein